MSVKTYKMDRRIDFDLVPERLIYFNRLILICGLKTRKSLIDNAFTLLEWAVSTSISHQKIATYDREKDHVEIVRFPILETAEARARIKSARDGLLDDNKIVFVNKKMNEIFLKNRNNRNSDEFRNISEFADLPSKSDRRIQFDILSERLEELDIMMEVCGMKTRKELIDSAITLLEWAVEARQAGLEVAAYNIQTGHVEIVKYPILEAAALRKQSSAEFKAATGENSYVVAGSIDVFDKTNHDGKMMG